MPQEIDIPDLPKNYVATKFGIVSYDANTTIYVFDKGSVRLALLSDNGAYMLQVKQVKPKRLILEQTNEFRKIVFGEWLEDEKGNIYQWKSSDPSSVRYRYWQVINEED